MTEHDEFVHEDAGRIFWKMHAESLDQIADPELFVLYSPRDLERLPPVPGVYIGFDERGRCQYVGESACVGKRIGKFGERDELLYCKYIAVVFADDERHMRQLEMYYMGLFDPVFNKQLYPRGKRVIARLHEISWDPGRRAWSVVGSEAVIDRMGRVKTAASR